MNDFMLYFAAAGVCLLLAHPLGDYFVQTDYQAQHKGAKGSRFCNRVGRWNCAKHAASYTAMQIAVMFSVFAMSDYDGPWLIVAAILVLNGLTHYVIDRRWTLEWFARYALGKDGWIDNDPNALPTLDQAAHLVLFLPTALGIAAFSI